MALKYDFNISSVDSGNVIVDGLVWTNAQATGLLIYAIILSIAIVSLLSLIHI